MPDRMRPTGSDSVARSDGGTGRFLSRQEATGTYGQLLPAASSYTYNADGSIATETIAGITTAYTYNTDGSIATMVRSGVTRTFSYNTDGTIATVA